MGAICHGGKRERVFPDFNVSLPQDDRELVRQINKFQVLQINELLDKATDRPITLEPSGFPWSSGPFAYFA